MEMSGAGLRLERIDDVTYMTSDQLASMYKLSPFVWRENDAYSLLLRVVNYSDDPSEKIARIHYGRSDDGLNFFVEDHPVIAPGPDVPGSHDSGGCEDPTVAMWAEQYY